MDVPGSPFDTLQYLQPKIQRDAGQESDGEREHGPEKRDDEDCRNATRYAVEVPSDEAHVGVISEEGCDERPDANDGSNQDHHDHAQSDA